MLVGYLLDVMQCMQDLIFCAIWSGLVTTESFIYYDSIVYRKGCWQNKKKNFQPYIHEITAHSPSCILS